jgi:hypothetical protein
MRKKVFVFFALLAVAAVGLWMLPSQIALSKTAEINRPYQVLERNIIDLNAWENWWPGKRMADSIFEYKGKQLHIDAVLLNGFQATAVDDRNVKYIFRALPLENKRVQINLTGIEAVSQGLLKKAKSYLHYFSYRNDINNWVDTVQDFFNDTRRVYGIDIKQTMVTDSVLVALKQNFPHNPSVKEVYDLIYELKDYIAKQGGKEDNFPMVNIFREADTSYLVMVAIATGLPVTPTDRYLLKRMELGYILEGEVKGGMATVKQAESNLNNYALDYSKTSIAIPYQLWVTNKIEEQDTTKWITKLYYPILY